jgi:hypothetical protein
MTSYHQAVAARYEGDVRDLSAHDGQSQAAEYVNADTGGNGAEENSQSNYAPQSTANRECGS